MAYITQLNGAVLGVGLDGGPLVQLPSHYVLNSLGKSNEITEFSVKDDGSANTLNRDDYLAVDTTNSTISGTYLGTGQISNVGLSLGKTVNGGLLNSNLGISVVINPITGYYMAGDDGSVNFISDQELSHNRLNATLTVKLPGFAPIQTTVPISNLTSEMARLDPTGLLRALGVPLDLTQMVVDTAIITPTQPANLPTTIADPGIVCFAKGTFIETEFGAVPVEMLQVGMKVFTKDNGLQELRWIGSVAVNLGQKSKLTPIRIKAGALGQNTPSSDLLVSPQHRILVHSKIAQTMFGAAEILIAAKQLLQIEGIDIADDLSEVEYFHFLFDRHEVVVSNGAETESLFTGPEALKAVGAFAKEEILSLFPPLQDLDYAPASSRLVPPGRLARKLVVRHIQKSRELVM